MGAVPQSPWPRAERQPEDARQQRKRNADPLSVTVTVVISVPGVTVRRICPSGGVNFAALSSRFEKTCANQVKSTSTQTGFPAANQFRCVAVSIDQWPRGFDAALENTPQIGCSGAASTLSCSMRETSSRSITTSAVLHPSSGAVRAGIDAGRQDGGHRDPTVPGRVGKQPAPDRRKRDLVEQRPRVFHGADLGTGIAIGHLAAGTKYCELTLQKGAQPREEGIFKPSFEGRFAAASG